MSMDTLQLHSTPGLLHGGLLTRTKPHVAFHTTHKTPVTTPAPTFSRSV